MASRVCICPGDTHISLSEQTNVCCEDLVILLVRLLLLQLVPCVDHNQTKVQAQENRRWYPDGVCPSLYACLGGKFRLSHSVGLLNHWFILAHSSDEGYLYHACLPHVKRIYGNVVVCYHTMFPCPPL